MPNALLVDYGGVLTTSVLDAFAAFCRSEGIDPEALATQMKAIMAEPGNLFHSVERGDIDTDDFEAGFAEEIGRRCGVAVDPTNLKARLFSAASTDDAMLGALRAARAAGIRTALLSNSWGVTRGGYPIESFPELFDVVVISGEVKLRKPDPEIYLVTAERVGVPPGECVFVDDFKHNVDGAVAAGMIGVHHVDTAATLDELERLFAIPLRAA